MYKRQGRHHTQFLYVPCLEAGTEEREYNCCLLYTSCVCSEPYTAKLSRVHNNSNVLAFGARVVGSELAKMITEAWLDAEFEGGRHERRVNMIMEIENR